MMKLLLSFAFTLVAVAGQRPPDGAGSWTDIWLAIQHHFAGDVIEQVHDYRFVEHTTTTHHLLIAIKDNRHDGGRQCFVVNVEKSWEYLLADQHNKDLITEELYQMISNPALPSTALTLETLENTYHDIIGTDECDHHEVHMVTYVPSIASTLAPTTTANVRPIG